MRWTLALFLSLILLALQAQAAPRADSSNQTIRLISTTVSYRMLVDRAPKREASKGDVLWAKAILRNAVAQFGRPKGAVVGSDTATFTLVSPTRLDVKVTVKLPGGTLRAAGRIRGPQSKTLRVTGGTGAFENARGTAEVRNISGERALNVYRLQLP